MKSKQIATNPDKYVLVFETGDELASGLKEFAEEHQLFAAHFTAVGAFSSVKLAWYNPQTKKYDTSVDLHQQVELLSLIGDVADDHGKAAVHAHVTVGLQDGTTRGGHLLEATIHPTCELFLEEASAHLQKKIDPDSGLALISL